VGYVNVAMTYHFICVTYITLIVERRLYTDMHVKAEFLLVLRPSVLCNKVSARIAVCCLQSYV
jgi:hypothetical protein